MTGADAIAFAHGQFCNDVRALDDGRWQWNAWLSPNGRVRAFFALLRLDANRLLIVLRGDGPVAFRDALARFVLRADVKIRVVDHAHLYGVTGDTELARFDVAVPAPNTMSRSAERIGVAVSPSRFIVIDEASTTTHEATTEEETRRWRLADIHDGIPEITTALYDAVLPHWLGLDRLNAISVRKGCYPGQEIMSRLHFKGGNKRSLYRIEFPSGHVPSPGSPIVEEGAPATVGQIVMAEKTDATTNEALAILPHASEAKTVELASAPGVHLKIIERFGLESR